MNPSHDRPRRRRGAPKALRGPAVHVALLVGVLLPAPLAPALGAQQHELEFRDQVRITGATVLRGGPASPPALYPAPLEGNVVGLRGDTLLFEMGNEPVYWIPLGVGRPVVERQTLVRDRRRLMILLGSVGGAAGATFAWGFHPECFTSRAVSDLGISGTCPDNGTAGEAALRGLAVGATVGLVAGLVFSGNATRRAWVRLPLEGLTFRTGPSGGGLTARFMIRRP